MLTPPSLGFWVCLHAAPSIGAIWVGVNPRYQRRDFEHLLGASGPCVLLAVSPFEDREIRAPYVMSGYFGNPEATAEAFTADGLLRTGDLGRRRPDGNLAGVVPVDHPTFQEVGFAFVEPRPGMVVTAEALRDYACGPPRRYRGLRGATPRVMRSM